MDNRKRLWLLRGAIILLALAALVGWWLIPGVRSFVQHSFSAFATLDQQALERFIHAYGPLAALVSFGSDDPAGDCRAAAGIFNTFANASLFGALWGGVLSWVSAMAGAALCFFIARVLGREVVEKLTGKAVLQSVDGFF